MNYNGKEFKVKLSPWRSVREQPVLVCQITTTAWLTAKNGHKFASSFFATSTIPKQDWYGDEGLLRELKEFKENMLKQRLKAELEDVLGARRGFPGVSGYFKIQNIEPY
jgi:hypothetical protein